MSEEQKPYKIEGRESTIFRVIKSPDNPYVMVDRRPVDNPKLSFKAKGILTYLLSRPDGWEVNVPDLVNHSTDGAAAIRTGLKELRDAHHIAYNPTRRGGYIKKWVIEVYEIPYDLPMPEIDRADGEAVLDSDFLQVGNRGEVLNKINNTESSKREVDSEIFIKLSELTGGGLNSNTPKFVDAWLERHESFRILEAIEIARQNKARSTKYVDEILITWEANGYPKTREEKVQERKTSKAEKNLDAIQSWLSKQEVQSVQSN